MLLYFQVALPKKGATKTVFAQAKQNTKMQSLYYAKGIIITAQLHRECTGGRIILIKWEYCKHANMSYYNV